MPPYPTITELFSNNSSVGPIIQSKWRISETLSQRKKPLAILSKKDWELEQLEKSNEEEAKKLLSEQNIVAAIQKNTNTAVVHTALELCIENKSRLKKVADTVLFSLNTTIAEGLMNIDSLTDVLNRSLRKNLKNFEIVTNPLFQLKSGISVQYTGSRYYSRKMSPEDQKNNLNSSLEPLRELKEFINDNPDLFKQCRIVSVSLNNIKTTTISGREQEEWIKDVDFLIQRTNETINRIKQYQKALKNYDKQICSAQEMIDAVRAHLNELKQKT